MTELGVSTSAAMFERNDSQVLEAFRRGEFDYVDAIGEVKRSRLLPSISLSNRLLDRDIADRPPLVDDRRARVAAGNDVPIGSRGVKNGEIRLAIAIVVSGHGNVSGIPPLVDDRSARVAARNDVPIAIRGPKHGYVCLAISIKVVLCAPRGVKCLDQVQPAMAHIGADGHRMSHSGRGP